MRKIEQVFEYDICMFFVYLLHVVTHYLASFRTYSIYSEKRDFVTSRKNKILLNGENSNLDYRMRLHSLLLKMDESI